MGKRGSIRRPGRIAWLAAGAGLLVLATPDGPTTAASQDDTLVTPTTLDETPTTETTTTATTTTATTVVPANDPTTTVATTVAPVTTASPDSVTTVAGVATSVEPLVASQPVVPASPAILCAWVLVDADHSWASAPAMQYGADDDPLAHPARVPCETSTGVVAQPDRDDPADVHAHVKPNLADLPSQAMIELWGAIAPTADGMQPFWRVYYPNGELMVQSPATRFASEQDARGCSGPPGMFGAAEAGGQLSSDAVAQIGDQCRFEQASLWYSAVGLSTAQPYGSYRIELHLPEGSGDAAIMTYHVAVQSFYFLEKDFTFVHFGEVSAHGRFPQAGAGDLVWDGRDNQLNDATSVRNAGNAGVGLDLALRSMCLATSTSCAEGERIDHFGARFGKSPEGAQAVGETIETSLLSVSDPTMQDPPPEAWYSFDAAGERVLCPDEVGLIEFSVRTEQVAVGTYESQQGILLRARPEPICPTDLGVPDRTRPPVTSNGYWTTGR